jgi:hypothetical protein
MISVTRVSSELQLWDSQFTAEGSTDFVKQHTISQNELSDLIPDVDLSKKESWNSCIKTSTVESPREKCQSVNVLAQKENLNWIFQVVR